METTVSIEFLTDTRQHLKELDHQLKAIHGVKVDLVEPRDLKAPILVAIGIGRHETQPETVANHIAQVLHGFLHAGREQKGNKKIFLVTAEGDRVDIEPLSVEEIKRIIFEAYEGE